MRNKKRVIFIVGPTAVGKTSFAVNLAKRLKGEIISADSMQAYRGMDILSQKPTASEQKSIPHHLIGFLDPEKEYSAAEFAKRARKIIKHIIGKGKIPIITGGSGLYVKALLDGIFPSKGKNEALRRRLGRLADEKGMRFLYNKLRKIDPHSAGKIHPNDKKRIIRALEIYEVEKKTKTSLEKKTKGIKDEYRIEIFGLVMERKKLYDRINKRVDLMFRRGLVEEVKKLLRKRLSITSRRAIGIKQVEGYLNGDYGLAEAKEALKRDTRRLAKRQLTWFRADKRIKWLDIGKTDGKGASCNAKIKT